MHAHRPLKKNNKKNPNNNTHTHKKTGVVWCHLATLGQLNTSHYRLASLKRLINPSDQPPVTIRQTSPHIGQSLHGQHRSTPTQVTGNWNARENVVCLSTWKTFVYSQLVTRPDRLYGLKNKSKGDAKCNFIKWKWLIFFFYLNKWITGLCEWYEVNILTGKQECGCINHLSRVAVRSWSQNCEFTQTEIYIPDTLHFDILINVAFAQGTAMPYDTKQEQWYIA